MTDQVLFFIDLPESKVYVQTFIGTVIEEVRVGTVKSIIYSSTVTQPVYRGIFVEEE